MQLTLRIFGFVASLLLTLAAYFLITRPEFFSLGATRAVFIIFILAIIQSIIQLTCFINIWREKGPLWNLAVFVSTLAIILIIIVFSIWIIDDLTYNMMP